MKQLSWLHFQHTNSMLFFCPSVRAKLLNFWIILNCLQLSHCLQTHKFNFLLTLLKSVVQRCHPLNLSYQAEAGQWLSPFVLLDPLTTPDPVDHSLFLETTFTWLLYCGFFFLFLIMPWPALPQISALRTLYFSDTPWWAIESHTRNIICALKCLFHLRSLHQTSNPYIKLFQALTLNVRLLSLSTAPRSAPPMVFPSVPLN